MSKKLETIAGIGTALLALAALITMLIFISNYREAISCQAEYNKNHAKALTERAEAANSDRAASRTLAEGTTNMLDSILNPSATVEQRKKSVEDWREANRKFLEFTTEADNQRASNPIPITPECALR